MVDPTARRISGLLRELGVLFRGMTDKDWLTRQMTIILDAVREEVEEDPELFANQAAKEWVRSFAQLMEWTATGDYSMLSPDLLPIACAIDGIQPPPAQEPLFEYKSQQYTTPSHMGGRIELPRVELCRTLVTLPPDLGNVMPYSAGHAPANRRFRTCH